MNVETISIPFDEELLPTKNLSTGKISCIYENGAVRYILYDGVEVIRMIYFAVRDDNWQTTNYFIENEKIDLHANGFNIFYTANHRLDEISYQSDVSIEAKDNRISFHVKGKALSDFKRNRIGICVLHPLHHIKGQPAVIQRPDGSQFEALFPTRISPHQPFKDIQQLQFQVDGTKAILEFEGEVFETEDQRNWSDSSFKTYSTPLSLPMPVQVKVGEGIEQKVTLIVTGSAPGKIQPARNQDEEKISFPKIGYTSQADYLLSATDIEFLKKIPIDHYRINIDLSKEDWMQHFLRKLDDAKKLESKLEVVLQFGDEFEHQLEQIKDLLITNSQTVERVLPLSASRGLTTPSLANKLYSLVKPAVSHIEFGYGTNGHFADLNRYPPINTHFDFVSFHLTPQVHATDTRTVIENLAAQADILDTIQAFAPGKKIAVGPITFKMMNSSIDENGTPVNYDKRQQTNFGAAWTLATIKNLSKASSLTFYDATGPNGLIDTTGNGAHLSPVYDLLKTIKAFNPKWIIVTKANPALREEIILEDEHGDRLTIEISLAKNTGISKD